MNITTETNTKVDGNNNAERRHAMGGTLLRWTGVMSLLAGIAVLGSIATTAAPASALIRFCNQTVCIGSGNGCNIRSSTGVVVMADDGDSFVGVDGTKWTCKHGKWETSKMIVSTTGLTTTAGNAQVLQAAPDSTPVDPGVTRADPRSSVRLTK